MARRILRRRTRYKYVTPQARKAKRAKAVDLMGTFGYAIAEPMIDNVIGGLTKNFGANIPREAVQFGLGYFLRNKGGIIGSVAKAAMVINAYQLSKTITAGGLNLFANNTPATATATNPSTQGW